MADPSYPWEEQDVKLDRRSVDYWDLERSRKYEQTSHFPSMFLDDAAQYLFPIDGRIEGEEIFEPDPPEDATRELLKRGFRALGAWDASSRSLSSILAKAGNFVAYKLLEAGRLICEVAPVLDRNGNPVAFSAVRVLNATRVLTFTIQTVPSDAISRGYAPTEQERVVEPGRVCLPRNRIVQGTLPRQYRGIPKGLEALQQAGRAIPEYAVNRMSPDADESAPYDLDEMTGLESRTVASITRTTGWNARGSFREQETGYYWMKRTLRFEEFRIHMREACLDFFNQVLKVAGEIADFEASLSLVNVPTLKAVSLARESLANGSLESFKDVQRKLSVYR